MKKLCTPVKVGIKNKLILAVFLILGFLSSPFSSRGDETLVGQGSQWKYLDNGTDLSAMSWQDPAFDDSLWPSGPAELGYGDGDEATTVGFGPESSAKYITTYFRHAFDVAGPSLYPYLGLSLLRDDGAVVYLNGTEVHRSNMPAGPVSAATTASSAVVGADEANFHQTLLDSALLQAGTNVLAVEIHQVHGSSSDISFDLALTGTFGTVTRGPYLQMGTPTRMVVRWRTDVDTDSRVSYGTALGSLSRNVDDVVLTTEHEVVLTSLSPGTTYYYSIGTTASILAGDSADYYFKTPPAAPSADPTRIWVIGDSGTANTDAEAVRDAYQAFKGSDHTDLWLMLGDNAYFDGTDTEYQAAVFDMYPQILRQTVLWPTLGNHDAISADTATQSGPYYDIFSLPAAGESGGLASGTEAYYSFDYNNIHFICLNSQDSSRLAGSMMLTWLEADLAATDKQWLIAFWHHPPYSKGSHDSDSPLESEGRLTDMRENVLPILENYGVDLVLCGHSHSYERSYLLDGHYGISDSLTSDMILDAGNGRDYGTGAYNKATDGLAPHEGTVYVVAGSSGIIYGGSLDHPAMFMSLNNLGSLVLDVEGNRLDARFVRETGAVIDSFTIIKGSPHEFTLELDASYAAGTLSMDFTVGTPEPALWATYLILTNPSIQVIPLWQVLLPMIEPAIAVPVAFPFPAVRWIGLYSALFTGKGRQAAQLVWLDTGV